MSSRAVHAFGVAFACAVGCALSTSAAHASPGAATSPSIRPAIGGPAPIAAASTSATKGPSMRPDTPPDSGSSGGGDGRSGEMGGPALSGDATRSATMDRREARSGLVLGAMGGYGLAGSSGYPNAADRIDDPRYYASSDLLQGGGVSFFALGALADYVNVGFWAGFAAYESGDWRSFGGGGGLRVELFPLWSIAPKLRDLGVVAQFGFGGSKLEAKQPGLPFASGSQSFLGAGAFYELPLLRALGGHLAAGPSLEYDAVYSRSIERHGALLGLRLAFYGGR